MAQMASTKLRSWVDDGPYARLFDRPTTIDLENRWLYSSLIRPPIERRVQEANQVSSCSMSAGLSSSLRFLPEL